MPVLVLPLRIHHGPDVCQDPLRCWVAVELELGCGLVTVLHQRKFKLVPSDLVQHLYHSVQKLSDVLKVLFSNTPG